MKVGDKVITHEDEHGIITKPWNRDDGQYSWWVEISFTADGKDYKSTIPYKESELKHDNQTHTLP